MIAAVNAVLPNLRLVGLWSAGLGEDWTELSLKIDEALPDLGWELAEESVYLFFDRAPGALTQGEGKALVMRSVVGPKRGPPAPFQLQDRGSAPAYTQNLKAQTLSGIFEEAFEVWQQLQRAGKKVGGTFWVCLRRRLGAEFRVEAQLIFTQ